MLRPFSVRVAFIGVGHHRGAVNDVCLQTMTSGLTSKRPRLAVAKRGRLPDKLRRFYRFRSKLFKAHDQDYLLSLKAEPHYG